MERGMTRDNKGSSQQKNARLNKKKPDYFPLSSLLFFYKHAINILSLFSYHQCIFCFTQETLKLLSCRRRELATCGFQSAVVSHVHGLLPAPRKERDLCVFVTFRPFSRTCGQDPWNCCAFIIILSSLCLFLQQLTFKMWILFQKSKQIARQRFSWYIQNSVYLRCIRLYSE